MILRGDCLEQMKTIEDNSIDSVVTDPPYGLSFMGKRWDYDVPSQEVWREVLRVLKPGGHLLSFGGTRTYHRLVVNIEDAGFEIRDCIQWLYGTGFPKSHNLTDKWQGWGTALKPANEPICVARKPLEKGLTVAENVLKFGTGAINVDASRIGTETIKTCAKAKGQSFTSVGNSGGFTGCDESFHLGRWPANVIFDEAAAQVLDEQSGHLVSKWGKPTDQLTTGDTFKVTTKNRAAKQAQFVGDSGGASRFFYVAKASKRERNAGLEGMPEKAAPKFDGGDFQRGNNNNAKEQKSQNFHPTVKPVKLMEYLIKMVTPPQGTVLDPFMGSGSTGVACKNLGFSFIGCELNPEYADIAEKRIGA